MSARLRNWRRGRVAKKGAPTIDRSSQMERILTSIAKMLIILSFVGVAFLFLFLLFYTRLPILDTLELCLVLMVASIPVAIEVVSTAVLAAGSRQLAAKDVLVTRLAAIEELAAVEVLCSDKRGTLTLNKLEMGETWCAQPERWDVARVVAFAALTIKRSDPDALDSCNPGQHRPQG